MPMEKLLPLGLFYYTYNYYNLGPILSFSLKEMITQTSKESIFWFIHRDPLLATHREKKILVWTIPWRSIRREVQLIGNDRTRRMAKSQSVMDYAFGEQHEETRSAAELIEALQCQVEGKARIQLKFSHMRKCAIYLFKGSVAVLQDLITFLWNTSITEE